MYRVIICARRSAYHLYAWKRLNHAMRSYSRGTTTCNQKERKQTEDKTSAERLKIFRFSSDPILYSSSSQMQRAVGREMMDLVEWSNVDRVVDLGCGTGELTAEMAGRILKNPYKGEQRVVLGIDGSKDRVDFASRFHSVPPLTRYHHGDLCDVSLFHVMQGLYAPFQLAFFLNVLQLISTPEIAIANASRLLGPSGKIVLFTCPFSSDWACWIRVLSQEKWKSYYDPVLFSSLLTAQKIDRLCQTLSLTPIVNKQGERTHVYPNLDAYINYAKGWVAWIAPGLPLELFEEFIHEGILELIDNGRLIIHGDGTVEEFFSSLVGVLEKPKE